MPPSSFFIQVKKKAYIGIFIIILGLLITGCSDHKTTVLSEQYKYDNKGRLISRITPDGRKTEYKYNKQGLPVEINYPGEFGRYGYDASANRIWMQNINGRTEYKYDAFDRLIEVIAKYSPEKKIRYEYDPWNRISAIEILDRDGIDYQVKYEYNIIGNLTSIDDGIGRIEYKYQPDKGEVVRHLPNGIKTIFSFSPIGELTTLKHLDRHNRLLASYRYEYDPPGKVSRVIEQIPDGLKTTKYDWDSRGYLNALHLPDGKTIRYQYDSMGNRTLEECSQGTIRYKYNNLGRLIKAGSIKCEWDKNGNLFSLTQKGQKTRFIYNERNLPSLVRLPKATIRYGWDGDGNMISKRTGKDITHYLPNPLAPPGFTLAEYDRMGKIQNAYLYGDTLLGQRDGNGQVQYFLEDGFNSIRCIADIKGNIVGKWDYSPFGEPLQKGGDISLNFRMAGERFLPEIKSYFISGRLYEPKIGRYLTPDSSPGHVKRFDSFNKYAHGCNAQGIFMEPRCNQTSKYRGWSYRVPEASKQILGGLQGVLEDTGTYGLPFNFTGIGELAELAGCQSGGQPVSWHELSKASEKTLGDFGTLTAHVSRFIGRRLDSPHHVYQPAWWRGPDQGIKSWSPEDAEEFSRAGLRLLGSKWGIGGILDRFGKGVGNLARFYGTRMDRPYWWWSPMKWMPQEQYLQRSEEQGKRQATLAAKADRRKYKNDERKYYFKPPGGPPSPPGGPPGEDGGPDTLGPLPGGLLPPDSTGEGSQGCPIPDGFPLPFSTIENQLGGIKLSSSAEFIGNLSTTAGAVYDPQRQCLVLVGEENVALPSIKPEDLAVALACAFDPRYGDPQFSLDPADRRNLRGKWLKAVYTPEEVISGSPFGKSMFEADWLLKQYAFGVSIDKEGRKRERESSVPGFKSTVDLTFEHPDNEQGQEKEKRKKKEKWARFWIVSDEMKLREHGNSIYFDVAKMRVKVKKQVPDPSSPTGLRDVETDDPIASAFAEQFSKLYDDISKESPEFARVKELAKAVALAKWIKKEHIPIDMGWVTEYVNKRIQTVDRVTALSDQRERRTEIPFTQGNRSGIRTIIRQVHLFGGVDLTVNPKFKPDNGQAESLQKEVVAALQRKETGPVFNVTHEGESLRAVVLPVTKSGQEMWKSSPTIDKDGVTYQFNNEGIITKSTDKFGNIAEYSYDAAQKLKAIKVRAKNGWEAFAEKDDQGSSWAITNPRGNVFQCRYGNPGYLSEIELDGKKLATYGYDFKGRVANIHYQGYKEKFSYANNGYIKEYEVQRVPKDTKSIPEVERISFAYDDSGNIVKINGPSIGHIDILYSENRLPNSVRTPQGEIHYTYNSGKRIKEVSFSSGLSARYAYDEEKLRKIDIKRGDKQAEYLFNEGRIVRACNLSGGKTEYGYDEKGLLNFVIDSEGNRGEYVYDESNRLREIHFPDGRWIEYNYGERKANAKKPHSIRGQSITVISHSSSSPIRKIATEKLKGIDYNRAILEERLNDDIKASKDLENGLIIDLFLDSRSMIHANLVYSSGNFEEIAPDIAKELSWLLNRTAKTRGKLGKTLLEKWEEFHNNHLSPLSKPAYWNSRDGKRARLKPILIIRSNEVNYKYANLEKVPVLADNFIIFIASKHREAKDVAETTAKELVAKINNIPRLSRENVVFAIRPPRMAKDKLSEWEEAIKELEEVVGKENVLFNPSKEEFSRMLNNRGKEIVVIELTHTKRGIRLKGDERYTSRDVFKGGDLSHVKYLIAGPGTCSLPRLEKGAFAATLRKKGVGIMNTSFGEVSTETALKRLREIIRILKNVDEYDIPTYYLPDIIDQVIDVPENEKGTTNLGKLDYHKRLFLS